MKLKSVKISNILSFQHYDNVDDCQKIAFNDGLNLFIGPNGAGKSNFIEIVNKIFKIILIHPCHFNESVFVNHEKDPIGHPLTNVLTKKNPYHVLPRNHQNKNNKQELIVTIKLESSDFSNLEFIAKNSLEINEIIKKYSNRIEGFPNNIISEDLKLIDEITIHFFDEDGKIFSTHPLINQNLEFIKQYFQNYEILQNIISLGNRFGSKKWQPLKFPFALMTSYRNYSNINGEYQILEQEYDKWQLIFNKITEESARQSTENEKEPVIFELVKHKLSYKYNEIEDKITNDRTAFSGKNVLDVISSDPLFASLDSSLNEHMKINLKISHRKKSLTYDFSFIDTELETISVLDLSSGQKAIIHFIFSLYGYEMKNGLIVIDEPELHLHPQIQQVFLEMLLKTLEKSNIQFIIATHSPLLVNSKTIHGVKRFYKENKHTKIIASNNVAVYHKMIKYLDYTRATNIMFSNNVVMVEGESDAFVFQYIYEKYREKNFDLPLLDFIHIVGKDAYNDWKKFFDDWQIKTFFIRDLDDFIGGSTKIEEKYNENIFILKKGDLETYVGKEKAGKFQNAIDFCENRYNDWITSESNKEKIDELNCIFKKIISNLKQN